jgi:N-methylhydantoinase B
VGDGLEVYGAQCNIGMAVTDVEMEELMNPGMILWRKVEADKGGAGTFRGGTSLNSAFAVLYSEELNGIACNNSAFVPARGAGGGQPGACGMWQVMRNTNVESLLKSGRLPVEDAVEGTYDEEMIGKTSDLKLRRGDIFRTVHGGGGGVGDPLLRDLGSVAEDVRYERVSREQAAAVYGVVFDSNGCPNEQASAAARAEIRKHRIGGTPEKDPKPTSIGISIELQGHSWCCAACGAELAGKSENWREHVVRNEVSAPTRLSEIGSFATPKRDGNQFVLREHFCPSCAASLTVDVSLGDRASVPVARLGRGELWAE